MKFVDKDSLNKFSSTDFEVSRDIYHFGYEEFQRLAHDMVNSKYGPEDGWKTYFEDLFDPVKNEVELHSISDISGSGECWSDRRCLLIQVNEWNDKFQR